MERCERLSGTGWASANTEILHHNDSSRVVRIVSLMVAIGRSGSIVVHFASLSYGSYYTHNISVSLISDSLCRLDVAVDGFTE
jgi:hypothetical protein